MPKHCTSSTTRMQMGSLIGILVHWGRRGNTLITSQSTSRSRCPFCSPGVILTLGSSANPVWYTRGLVHQSRSQLVITPLLFSPLSLFITLLVPSYSAPLCRLFPLLSPSTPWLNEPEACLVGEGSPYKARRWSQRAARYLPSITTPLTTPCRLLQQPLTS